jgi:DnaJ family protein C protein 19
VIFLLLGCASLLVVMGALGMFSRAQVANVKQFGVWTVAIGGLLMAALLFLTGRGAIAIGALVMLGPLIWSWVGLASPEKSAKAGATRKPASKSGAMTRAEALEVLGVSPNASKADIQAAYIRLMQAAHPDRGGSDWLAARINQARDVLLG